MCNAAPVLRIVGSQTTIRKADAKGHTMKMKLFALAALGCMLSVASAQDVLDLSGQFRCVQGCDAGLIGQPAYVSQRGWELRLMNEAGAPARAWIDRPGHIWVQSWDEGAVYSADGMTISFRRGTVWVRDIGQWEKVVVRLPPPIGARPIPGRRRAAIAAEPIPATARAFDGAWSVQIITQAGPCDRTYRFPVRISNGSVVNEFGDAVSLQGRVASNGAIQVSVSAAGQQANGEGRLSPTAGSGTWRGQGSAGSCAGVWEAARRG
jgi:hypothetical protein